MNKKVMIVHASAGMGHTSAAKAIRDAFVQKYPDVDARYFVVWWKILQMDFS